MMYGRWPSFNIKISNVEFSSFWLDYYGDRINGPDIIDGMVMTRARQYQLVTEIGNDIPVDR
jgi:hypothetical protein